MSQIGVLTGSLLFVVSLYRRRLNVRELLFYRLAQQAIAVGPAPYSSIIYGKLSVRV